MQTQNKWAAVTGEVLTAPPACGMWVDITDAGIRIIFQGQMSLIWWLSQRAQLICTVLGLQLWLCGESVTLSSDQQTSGSG